MLVDESKGRRIFRTTGAFSYRILANLGRKRKPLNRRKNRRISIFVQKRNQSLRWQKSSGERAVSFTETDSFRGIFYRLPAVGSGQESVLNGAAGRPESFVRLGCLGLLLKA